MRSNETLLYKALFNHHLDLYVGEYRSRSATMATERSDFSQTHVQEARVKTSITEITAEIIGVPKPTLATIGKRASKSECHECNFKLGLYKERLTQF